jgi:colanic acid/amylovoran biosynthesis glycosyltransferase
MSRPLRIAMFAGSFPVISETFIVRQIIALLDLGHEVDIYADTRADPQSPVHCEVADYRLLDRTTFMDMPAEAAPWEMPVLPLTGRTWLPGSDRSVRNATRVARAIPTLLRCAVRAPGLTLGMVRRSESGYRASSLSAIYRLGRLLGRPNPPDVIHAQFGPVGNSFRFARRLWKAPLVVSFHGYDFCTVPRREGARVYEKLFADADAVIVNSDFTRQRVEALGCPPHRIRKIPVGLDPGRFPFRERVPRPDEPVRILTVGRLVEIKGHEYCLRAVSQLRERHPAVRLEVAGDGPLRRPLEDLAAKLKLQGIVTFHGACDGLTVSRLMNESHLFVLASVNVEGDQEGQGLVLQEAQACGLPVIATNSGGLPEGLVPGRSGFLVPERDADALAGRLAQLIEHPELLAPMGRCGRAWIEERYDLAKLSRRMVELYAETLANYRSGNS